MVARAVILLMTSGWIAAAYQCQSDVSLGLAANAHQKGIAVDDSTLQWCSSQIPDTWPNAPQPMTSIRLFKAWDESWTESTREKMWNGLLAYVKRTNAKVLIGAQIHCSEQEDIRSWMWTKELLQRLHREHVMGLAIGNELELLRFKGSQVSNECVLNVWERGYFWRMFQHIVGEFDAIGFADVPVTSVFTGQGLAGNPFYEVPNTARVGTFLKNVTDRYGDRFAFTWNFYPYFDPNQPLDANTADQCNAALARASCWGENCFMPSQLRQARIKMKQLTGKSDDTMWVGETGWSSPMGKSLQTQMKNCPAWSSMQTFQDFYRGFLNWDLSIGGGFRAPDHAFWFTMRDSINFGAGEHFGLIAKCDDPTCKVKSPGYEAGSYQMMGTMSTSKCGDAYLYDGWVVGKQGGEEHCRNKCTMQPLCRYFTVWPLSHDDHYWCRLTPFCDHRESTAPHTVMTFKRLGMPPVPTPEAGATTPPPGTALLPDDGSILSGASSILSGAGLMWAAAVSLIAF